MKLAFLKPLGLAFSAVLFVYSTPLWGQTKKPYGLGAKPKIAEVHGVVMDAQKASPLPYASVVLVGARDSSVVAGVMSDEKGRFDLTEVEVGKVWLEVRFPGYKTTRIGPHMLTPRGGGTLNWQVGKVAMEADITALQEAVVVEQASIMEMRVDRKVFYVGNDLTSRGNNTTELLENIPSVAVDIDGNITLRGSAGVQILIDGRPSGLAGGAREAFLESLPASAVDRVELITNPSARFDPDGTAGILNIVLKKNRLEGFSGQVQATYGTGDNHDANASLNYRTSSVSLSSNVGWNDRWMFMAGETDRTQFWPGDSTSESFVSRPGDSHRGSLSGSLKAEWRVTSSWTVFGGFNQSAGIRDGWDTTRTAESWSLTNGEDLYATDALRTQQGVADSKGGDMFGGFERTFRGPGHKWTGDVRKSTSVRVGDNAFLDSSLVLGSEQNAVASFNNQTNDNERWLAQTDYERPWGEKGKIEAGMKATWNKDVSAFQYTEPTGTRLVDGIYVPDLVDTVDYQFGYDERIFASYLTVGQQWGMLGVQGGLRAEQAYTSSYLDGESNSTPFQNDYFRVYPSANAFVETDGENTWSLSYSRRVNRPRGRQLNPYLDVSDPRNYRTGNPFLLPEFTNSYELSHQWRRRQTSVTSSLFFKDTRDVISRLTSSDTLTGVLLSSFQNLGRQHSEGLEVVVMVPLGKQGQLNWTTSGYRVVNDGSGLDSPFSSAGFSWSTRFFASWTVAEQWKFQANSFVRGAAVTPQGRFNGFATLNLAMSRNLPSDQWQMTLQVKDVFNTRRWSYSTAQESLFEQEVWRQRESRNLYLTLQWKFGNLEERGRRGSGSPGGQSSGGDDFLMD